MTKGSPTEKEQPVILYDLQKAVLLRLVEAVNQRRSTDSDGKMNAQYELFDPQATYEITQAALDFVLSMELAGLSMEYFHREVLAMLQGENKQSQNFEKNQEATTS